jgi:hypothetical protein
LSKTIKRRCLLLSSHGPYGKASRAPSFCVYIFHFFSVSLSLSLSL